MDKLNYASLAAYLAVNGEALAALPDRSTPEQRQARRLVRQERIRETLASMADKVKDLKVRNALQYSLHVDAVQITAMRTIKAYSEAILIEDRATGEDLSQLAALLLDLVADEADREIQQLIAQPPLHPRSEML